MFLNTWYDSEQNMIYYPQFTYYYKHIFALALSLLVRGVFARKDVGFRQGQPMSYNKVFESSIKDIQWIGRNDQTILIQTYSDRLWRSPDTGRSWDDITDKLAVVAGMNNYDG